MSRRQPQSSTYRMPVINEDEVPRIPPPKSRLAPTAWASGPPRASATTKKASSPKVEPPSSFDQASLDAAFAPWPESDYDERPKSEPRKPVLARTEIENLGDKIVKLITAEVAMCRGMSVKTPQTYIRLYPSPPYDYMLNAYVVEKAQTLTETGINWHFGRDVITIVF